MKLQMNVPFHYHFKKPFGSAKKVRKSSSEIEELHFYFTFSRAPEQTFSLSDTWGKLLLKKENLLERENVRKKTLRSIFNNENCC